MRKPISQPPLWKTLKEERAGADDILRTLGIAFPPVDVQAVAQRLGITLGWSDHHSGELRVEGDDALILIRKGEALVRQRFTVAHELGHLMLHSVDRAYRHNDSTFAGNTMEIQANQFAADLLMPLWMMDPAAQAFGADLKKLAQLFKVSEQAAKLRFQVWAGL
ncbi:MAG: ImmA/IrrE family metallo-endopeptidase [Myxococcaceae bacterium]